MSENKRVRPTVGQVRKLEDEISQLKEEVSLLEKASGYTAVEIMDMEGYKRKYEKQLEGTSALVAESDAWRDKYRMLVAKHKTLEASNKYLEDERTRLNNKLNKALDRIHELETETFVLKTRGFWARVFNKGV